jgi:hypothetical protein
VARRAALAALGSSLMGGVSSGVEALGAVAGTSTGISSLETCSSEKREKFRLNIVLPSIMSPLE